MIVIIDIEYFSCNICAEKILAFCKTMKTSEMKSDIWIVISIKRIIKEEKEEKHIEILKRQWKGFCKANEINWPYVFDNDNIYKNILKSEAAIIIHDKMKNNVYQYLFPLKQIDIEEIKKII